MIYDVNAPPWWRYTIPFREGKPVKVFYRHSIRGWSLVRDPHGLRRVYWEDSAGKVRRFTPPPFDKKKSVARQEKDCFFLIMNSLLPHLIRQSQMYGLYFGIQ